MKRKNYSKTGSDIDDNKIHPFSAAFYGFLVR